jgi:hypothetical protein
MPSGPVEIYELSEERIAFIFRMFQTPGNPEDVGIDTDRRD